MSEGIVAELSELIALRQYTQHARYQPERRAVRAGNHLSKLRGRGMDFSEVRNYQAGDEIRHMEWRVTARTGKPHVKLYQEERERPAIILTDFNPSMYFGTRHAFKSVTAAKLAAIIAWTANRQGDRVGGLIFSASEHHEFPPRSRKASILPLLASLSDYTRDYGMTRKKVQPTPQPLSRALQRLRRVTRPGSIVVLISDFYNLQNDSTPLLSQLRINNDVLAYHICDPLELAPPKPQQYGITNSQEKIILDTTVNSVTLGYQHYCDQRVTAVKDQLLRLNIQYTQVTPELNLPNLVQQTYPRRAHA